MKVRWTSRAANNLREIAGFIALDNPTASLRLVRRIKAKVNGLARYPRSGRIVPETNRISIRELIVGNYRVIYQLGFRDVDILVVVEGHRRLPSDLDQ